MNYCQVPDKDHQVQAMWMCGLMEIGHGTDIVEHMSIVMDIGRNRIKIENIRLAIGTQLQRDIDGLMVIGQDKGITNNKSTLKYKFREFLVNTYLEWTFILKP